MLNEHKIRFLDSVVSLFNVSSVEVNGEEGTPDGHYYVLYLPHSQKDGPDKRDKRTVWISDENKNRGKKYFNDLEKVRDYAERLIRAMALGEDLKGVNTIYNASILFLPKRLKITEEDLDEYFDGELPLGELSI